MDKKIAFITDLQHAERLGKLKEDEENKKQKQASRAKKCTKKKIDYQESESSMSEREVETKSQSDIIEDEDFKRKKKLLKHHHKILMLSLCCNLYGNQFCYLPKKEIFYNNGMDVFTKNTIKTSKKQAFFIAKLTFFSW